jgi:DNA-binding IclR family transcriptional regulator
VSGHTGVRANESYFASRAMQALEILAFGPAGATQIARELGVHPRTARRLLNRMTMDGWLVRHDGPRATYAPTLRILALAAEHAHRLPLLRHAPDAALELHTPTGHTVHLAVPSYRCTLRLLRAGDGRVRSARDLAPAHATAAGKVLLAFRERWRDAVLAAPLLALADGTPCDSGALRVELERARTRGYAIEAGEYRAGHSAVAAPVIADGEVIAALAVSGPGDRAAVLAHRGAVIAVAQRLSARLADP